MGWAELPDALITREAFAAIGACGITLVMAGGEPDRIRRQLDLAAEAGLGVMVCDRRFTDLAVEDWSAGGRALIADFAAHPAAVAALVMDEPQVEHLPLVRDKVAFLRDQAPGWLPWVNAYGFSRRGGDDFADYVDRYARIIQPPMLSFDHYPICRMPPASLRGRIYDVEADCGYEVPELQAYYRDGYWSAWETFHAAGRRYDLPLWGFVLATPHQHTVWSYGPVTEGTIRLEAFTGLAYGARAIQYFTLPSMEASGYEYGILDPWGGPSPRYELVRRVNRELAVLGPLVAGLRCVGVYYTGALTSGTRAFTAVRGERDSPIEGVARIDGDPVMASHLVGPEGERHLILVNRSPARWAEVEVTFAGEWGFVEIVKSLGRPNPATFAKTRRIVSLEPGDGKLYRLIRNP